MKIVVAPDSFKGSLTSPQAAEAMSRGILSVFPEAKITKVPIADGGEGTVNAIISASQGKLMHTMVSGPLGEPVNAAWGKCTLKGQQYAVIEMAEASGILLEKAEERRVLLASTYGTGQLILAALDEGIRHFIIGIGGSATNDGGAGMAEALGVKLLDDSGVQIPRGGAALAKLASIDASSLDSRLVDCEILICSDVTNPLCGQNGASAVYGPQKGASPADVQVLDAALHNYARIAARDLSLDVENLPGAGAAGGLGAGLMLFCHGSMRNGIELILDLIEFDRTVSDADLVFTGEGYSDSQTANGKAPVGVAQIAKRHDVPVVCLSGGLSEDAFALLEHGIDAVNGTPCAPVSLEMCIKNADHYLEMAARRSALLIALGKRLH